MKFKKYFIMLLLLGLVTQVAKAQETGIQFFHGTWAEVKAEAKKQNKPIFMDAFTSWCGPCKRMSANVFTKAEVGDFYNKNFINYKLDMEKGEGPQIAQMNRVAFYPTYLFFNTDGELMHRAMGAKGPEDFIKDGQTAMDPQNNLTGQIKRFKNGERDSAFLQSFLSKLQDLDANTQKEVLDTYWQGKKMEELTLPGNWVIFRDFDNDILSDRYDYIFKNRKTFNDKFGKAEVDAALINKAGQQMQTALETKNDALYNRVHTVLLTADKKEIKEFTAKSEVLYKLVKKDMKAFNKLAPEYVNTYISKNADELNQLAWTTFQNTDDKDALKNAETWAKQSIGIQKTYANTDTYASLLYKNKKYKEAETAANEAIALAKTTGEDATSTTELLEKIRKEIK
jgi:thiol-disulfide isomerase/thioredoxin